MLIQTIATVRGPGLVYETPTLIRGKACTEVSLGGEVAHAWGYTNGYTMVLVLAHNTWQHSPEYTGKRGGEALPERATSHSRTRRMPTFFLSFLRRQTFDTCHPFAQYIQFVTITISLAYTSSLPATNLVNDIAWTLHSTQPVPQ